MAAPATHASAKRLYSIAGRVFDDLHQNMRGDTVMYAGDGDVGACQKGEVACQSLELGPWGDAVDRLQGWGNRESGHVLYTVAITL